MSLNANAQEFVPTGKLKISGDERYFENPFKSWKEIQSEKGDIIKKCDGNTHAVISMLSPNLDQQFIDYIVSFIQYVLKEYNPEIVEEYEFRGSVYTGILGFCILFLRIIQIIDEYNNIKSSDNKQDNNKKQENKDNDDIEMKEDDISSRIWCNKSKYQISKWRILTDKLCKICNCKNIDELRNYLLHSILKYNNTALNDFDSRQKQRYSFLEGIAGAYGVRIVYYYYLKNDKKMMKYIEKLKGLTNEVQKLDAMELLYGRIGYVSTFVFINHFIGDYNNLNLLKCNEITNICSSIIESGKKYVSIANNLSRHDFLKQNNIPLMWEWHESQYFGGAHGVAGILNIMLSIPSVVNKYGDILISMVDCCKSFRFKSGNYASSIRGYYKQRDSLVQFCHGPTGFISMYIMANKVINNNKYIQYAIDGQEIIWKRGLLRKGVGLCHGIGGNGYTFLSCYKLMKGKELKYLYRALQFAQVIVDKNIKFARKPDRPDSLFEGKCGGVIFVLDAMFAPETATFPCYEY